MTAVLVLLLLLAAQAPALPPQPAAATPSPDPANSAFAGTTGMILVAIKPAATADYESIIRELQAALAKDTDAPRRAATKGWHVFKAATPDAKGNALYIHMMLPAVPGFDYRPSLLVDTLVKDLAPELLTKYQEAFAGPPTKLDLAELAQMAVAPMPLPDAKPTETKKPGR
ncbi:MAG: hypothetical protein Q8O42_07725 [Acidobacteriota bacterium]|nr:hypothetical protein [Acidobacteriota bacterium]